MGTDLSGPAGGGWEADEGCGGRGGDGNSLSSAYPWASSVEEGLRHFDICPKLGVSC